MVRRRKEWEKGSFMPPEQGATFTRNAPPGQPLSATQARSRAFAPASLG